ncbi:MAG: tRNA preQ1(34) S-adenosylmethionine ribosyltransferase-isomerase QueA [Patescibacteria group bacterium]
MKLLVKDFDYHLPPELIAQQPAKPRDHSRLLVLNKKTGEIEHRHFYDIVEYFQTGDILVLNNSKVFPARLIGHKKESGGAVEIFLHQNKTSNTWQCLVRGRVKEGLLVVFKNKLVAEILENNNDGTWLIKFNLKGLSFWRAINKIGEVPLPPYIKRNKQRASDKHNYQTVFADAKKVGSAAAPTAGLHFTAAIIKKIKARGVKVVYVTLHVGLGTFAPMKTEKITEHKMHSELVEIPVATMKTVLKAKKNGQRVIAVGTTSCRTLESIDWPAMRTADKLQPQAYWTDIFIYPGYKFQVVDALITNFHLPKSTLLMLVSTLAGAKNIKRAYSEAILRDYRFFSYGDAMFIK